MLGITGSCRAVLLLFRAPRRRADLFGGARERSAQVCTAAHMLATCCTYVCPHVNRRPSTAPAAPQGNLNTRAIDELKSIYGERLVILSPGLASPFNLLAYWQAMRRST